MHIVFMVKARFNSLLRFLDFFQFSRRRLLYKLTLYRLSRRCDVDTSDLPMFAERFVHVSVKRVGSLAKNENVFAFSQKAMLEIFGHSNGPVHEEFAD